MTATNPSLRVLGAHDARDTDESAIAGGIPSRLLMQRAGAAAAAEIAHRFPDALARGVLLLAGPGHNGGDAWVIARALAVVGVRCQVCEVGSARTADAIAERAMALPSVTLVPDLMHPTRGTAPGLVVDGLLGTGASGAPRGAVADAIARIGALRAAGVPVVALDVPSGLDATTGEGEGAVVADLTLTFGSVKRGLLIRRDLAGQVVALDIGLPVPEVDDPSPRLVDGVWVQRRLPAIGARAHKGDRGKLAIVGGAVGMTGAVVLAARAAAAAGVGMVRLVVPAASLPVVQVAAPEAMATAWEDHNGLDAVHGWADVVLAGPGLGRSPEAEGLLRALLERWRGPIVLDADALNAFAGRPGALGELLAGHPALITPHPAEFARLVGLDVGAVLASRFDRPRELAASLGAAVLLKGTPTVLGAPDGRCLVSAAGTPALATAGSGDVLAGVAATLLAQMDDPLHAAACATWLHGRAAELAGGPHGARGTTLADVLAALPAALREQHRAPRYPVLGELPAVR